jgi:hypothetical protein
MSRLIGGQLETESFTDLQAFSPTVDGTTFICQERANAKYILQPSGYTALPGDVTFANGRVGALQIDGKYAPIEQFGSLQEALNRGVHYRYLVIFLRLTLMLRMAH